MVNQWGLSCLLWLPLSMQAGKFNLSVNIYSYKDLAGGIGVDWTETTLDMCINSFVMACFW